ncbi:hypothetical protein LCGC14_2959500 [marine sediment metagenome]|uniref:DUF4258 domain-containing protein n=1 Tax=marine sediment metagenome TaxID=412755 RepID=A0A0F8XDJ9_9ZZZZ
MRIRLTDHARFEAERRGISEDEISSVVQSPEQRILSKKERVILQNKYYDTIEGRDMLLRVIGSQMGDVFEVITVYRTSRIEKYWSGESA